MTSKNDGDLGRKTHLKKYLPYNGKWQFFFVTRINGRPRPELVIIDGKERRGTRGTYYLEWRENSKRRTRPVGTTPREAPEEEAAKEGSSETIRAAVDSYLAEILQGHCDLSSNLCCERLAIARI